jgi:hypothetical protein
MTADTKLAASEGLQSDPNVAGRRIVEKRDVLQGLAKVVEDRDTPIE